MTFLQNFHTTLLRPFTSLPREGTETLFLRMSVRAMQGSEVAGVFHASHTHKVLLPSGC